MNARTPDYLLPVAGISDRATEILLASDEGRLTLAERSYVAREIRRAARDVRAAREQRDNGPPARKAG